MSILSSIINKVLPGDPTRKITNLIGAEKWIAPEHKDMVEGIAVALATAGMAGAGPLAGAFEGFGGSVGGNISAFLQGDVGKILTQALANAGGDVGKLGGLLGMLGLKGKTKDIVEQVLALMALSVLGKKYAEEAIKSAKELEAKEKSTITSMLAKAEELFPTEEREEKEFAKGAEDIEKAGQKAQAETIRALIQRGGLQAGAGAGTLRRLQFDVGKEKLALQRDIDLARPGRTLTALQAQRMGLDPLSDLALRERARAEDMRMLPTNIALSLYDANRASPQDTFYQAEIDRLQRERGGRGDTAFSLPQFSSDGFSLSSTQRTPTVVRPEMTSAFSPTTGTMRNPTQPYKLPSLGTRQFSLRRR